MVYHGIKAKGNEWAEKGYVARAKADGSNVIVLAADSKDNARLQAAFDLHEGETLVAVHRGEVDDCRRCNPLGLDR